MELAGGQRVHTHGKAFSTSTGQCNERWRALPCNATQPPSLHLVLVRERRRPVGCQGTFPTGRPAIFSLSLWFLHWAPSHIPPLSMVSALGTQGRHPCRLLSIGCQRGKATVHPIRAKRAGHSFAKNVKLHCLLHFFPCLVFFFYLVLIAFSLNYVDKLLLNSA